MKSYSHEGVELKSSTNRAEQEHAHFTYFLTCIMLLDYKQVLIFFLLEFVSLLRENKRETRLDYHRCHQGNACNAELISMWKVKVTYPDARGAGFNKKSETIAAHRQRKFITASWEVWERAQLWSHAHNRYDSLVTSLYSFVLCSADTSTPKFYIKIDSDLWYNHPRELQYSRAIYQCYSVEESGGRISVRDNKVRDAF